ncbi:phosphatidylinositol-binding protein scs2 [Dimargaris cristalligena]|nr:phosphatidylinositol-binding protein scs2 [Dimargaris cristalligena]
MSLVIEPTTHLTFKRPFDAQTEDILVLRNQTSFPIAFKVKTTAPKQYCVRPNSGRIEPGLEIDIQVALQPVRDDLPANYKCKDKFLIQSIEVTPELETLSLNDLWPTVEKTDKTLIHERKLRCQYLAADPGHDASVPSPLKMATNVTNSSNEEVQPSTPLRSAGPVGMAGFGAAPAVDMSSPQVHEQFASPIPAAAPLPMVAQPVAPMPQPAMDTPTRESSTTHYNSMDSNLRSQLDAAEGAIKQLQRETSGYKSEIGSMRSLLKETQDQLQNEKTNALRTATSTPRNPTSTTTLVAQEVDGFSPQVLALVGVIAFLMGYLFF